MLFSNLIQSNLKTSTLGSKIEYYPRLNSTNEEAWELIENNEIKVGEIIVTDNQFEGKGRRGDKWKSSPGKSITFSLITNFRIDPKISGWIPLISGISVQKALLKFKIKTSLKWPNDIILNGKKLGGILCESKNTNQNIQYTVIGIGINVNDNLNDLQKIGIAKSTSTFIETEKYLQRERVIAEILNEAEPLLEEFPKNISQIKKMWESSCCHMNKEIKFHKDEKVIDGKFLKLNDFGAAILNTKNGDTEFYSGKII